MLLYFVLFQARSVVVSVLKNTVKCYYMTSLYLVITTKPISVTSAQTPATEEGHKMQQKASENSFHKRSDFLSNNTDYLQKAYESDMNKRVRNNVVKGHILTNADWVKITVWV